jgi:hypothetical protein
VRTSLHIFAHLIRLLQQAPEDFHCTKHTTAHVGEGRNSASTSITDPGCEFIFPHGSHRQRVSYGEDIDILSMGSLSAVRIHQISGELADCTLESLFTLSPAGHLFAPLAAGHVSIEGHPSATPSLVRTDCDRTHSPLRVGPHTHCGSPNWRFEDQGLVCTQDSQTVREYCTRSLSMCSRILCCSSACGARAILLSCSLVMRAPLRL